VNGFSLISSRATGRSHFEMRFVMGNLFTVRQPHRLSLVWMSCQPGVVFRHAMSRRPAFTAGQVQREADLDRIVVRLKEYWRDSEDLAPGSPGYNRGLFISSGRVRDNSFANSVDQKAWNSD